MSKKQDIETIIDSIVAFLKANLNGQLLLIDAEKNDGLTLRSVDSRAYLIQSLDEFAANFDPYLYVGIDSVQTLSEYGASAASMKIETSLIVSDPQDGTIFKSLFRYQRALTEVIEKNFYSIAGTTKFKITGLEPVAFTIQNNTTEFKAIGVMIEADIF